MTAARGRYRDSSCAELKEMEKVSEQRQSVESGNEGLGSGPGCHKQAVWPWVSHHISLGLVFLTCKMGIRMPTLLVTQR